MSRISDKILDEILYRCDIAELIASYIPLKKAGRNFKALCPFHHEKTPSFVVSSDKQIFHCFGCGAGGDIFSFVMRHERIDFPEAVKFLADRVGVEFVAEANQQMLTMSIATKLYKINELAAWFFNQNLLNNNAANTALKYLEQRDISLEVIKNFKLGFTPDAWDSLLCFLKKKSISDDLLLKSGLVIRNVQGKLYDRFRNRIMFPIFNNQGKIVGFGGRIFQNTQANEQNEENQPKYINSPETSIYIKSKNLYGLNFSKKFIQDENYCVIVEGYLDFILPFTSGIKNLVASLGTAFTIDHVRMLKRYTQNLVIVFDADDAGQEAALRSLDLLIEEGMNVRIAELKAGFDPDTYVREYGADEFKDTLTQAKSLFDFKIGLLSLKYKIDTPEGKTQIAQDMLSTIKKIKNAITRASYIKKLSEQLKIDEQILITELKEIKDITTIYSSHDQNIKKEGYKVRKTAEKMLISLLFDDNRLINELKKNLAYYDFSDPVIQKIVKYLYKEEIQEIEPAKILNRINDPDASSFICNLLVSDLEIKDRKKSFEDCIKN
ncbi:MAG: DNA primase [Candidatus Omnitrophota bacterium]